MFELDGWQHECGVIGIVRGANESFNMLELLLAGMVTLQHRGPEAAGFGLADGRHVKKHKGWGRIDVAIPMEVVTSHSQFDAQLGVGHVRYATQGSADLRNAQPHYIEPSSGRVLLASNGDVVNYWEMRRFLESQGVEINTENDGELILKAIDFYRHSRGMGLVEAIKVMSESVRGTWSAILLTRERMIVFCDRIGNRPLSIGKLGDTRIFTSETCVIDNLGAEFMRDVKPGEIIDIDLKSGHEMSHHVATDGLYRCYFEHIYFARPDSVVFGEEVALVRARLGRRSAERHPVPDADFVTPVPESGIYPAMGFAEAAGLPYRRAIVRNHYVGRTFIISGQDNRERLVRLKFNITRQVWGTAEKPQIIVVIVDDSIVRATTTRALIQMVRRTCRQQTGLDPIIHFRTGSPPIRFPCFYGIDTPTRDELIAARKESEGIVNIGAISEYIGSRSLGYLECEDLHSCVGCPGDYCYACMDGNYPIGTKDSREV